MFYQLPPVGHPIVIAEHNNTSDMLEKEFTPHVIRFFSSGTAALAVAISAVLSRRKIRCPEVILPAYGCPDLVSAVVFTGAKPVLVDLERERPWMDIMQLKERITASTAAVVAVDLFGIPERMRELRDVTDRNGIVLIEDSAQSFPSGQAGRFWSGDLVVLSFGRGKPVSLLGGGAVLTEQSEYCDTLLKAASAAPKSEPSRWLFRIKALLYNRMLSPRLYWIPQSMPFLKLGQTRYEKLTRISAMDDLRLRLLAENIAQFRRFEPKYRKLYARYTKIIAETPRITNLPLSCGLADSRRLPRFPILVPANERERIYSELKSKGLGASLMYPSRLNSLRGLEGILDQAQQMPAADDFSSRLLTLPLHDRVGERDLRELRSILLAVH